MGHMGLLFYLIRQVQSLVHIRKYRKEFRELGHPKGYCSLLSPNIRSPSVSGIRIWFLFCSYKMYMHEHHFYFNLPKIVRIYI